MRRCAAHIIVVSAVWVLAITVLVATVFQKSLLPPAHQEIKMARDVKTDRQHSVSNNVTDASRTTTTTAPGKLFSCGYSYDNLRKYWFPEYEMAGVYNNASAVTSPNDIMLFGMHGTCVIQALAPTDYYIAQHFRAKILYVNGESSGKIGNLKEEDADQQQPAHYHSNAYQIGGGPVSDTDHSIARIYYAALVLFESQPPHMWPRLLDPTQRPQWNGRRSRIVSIVRKCHPHRQQAAAELSSVVPLDTFGKCTVDNATKADLQTEFPELAIHHYRDNWKLFHNYKYCLVMENADVSGYISEKIVLAFLGGCLPIYWGTKEVFDVFNRDAFLFYEPGQTKSLEELVSLEQNNSTKYYERLAAPILANGNQTIRDYFSLADDIGGGHLKQRIRTMLGLLPNR